MADQNQAQLCPIVTRKDAMAAGLKRYFTGDACARGHIAPRQATNQNCIDCIKITATARRKAAPGRDAEYQRRYRTKNPDKVAAARKIADAHPKRKEKSRIRAANKRATPEGLAYRLEYASRPEVKERDAAKQKTPEGKARGLRYKAKPESKLKRAKRMRGVRSTAKGCLNNRMSVALHRGLKTGKQGVTWSALVGYTVADLRRHIERQFLPRMSWDNAGLWHIDHILPLASFTFTTPDDPEFKAAWALTNLRPLWAVQNMSKHAKREFLL